MSVSRSEVLKGGSRRECLHTKNFGRAVTVAGGVRVGPTRNLFGSIRLIGLRKFNIPMRFLAAGC